ncbi:hypothetical protein [Burkholderia gladioli]|uniref:hypothetical protein n=1 Tax=Burkholderia gladioli TaxID=28095 RepID=UPI00163EDD9D|nr:hypothetical protein [Burkholderia gladioli]
MSLHRAAPPTVSRDASPERGGARAAATPRERGSTVNPWPWPAGAFPARCPLCGGALEPMPGMEGRARHRSTRNSARCVLTTRRYQPDELIVRGGDDEQLAERQRARFLQHWERHLLLARRVWPSLTLARFTTLLALADVLGLWSHPSLREDDLVAVLLVMAGFMRLPQDAAGMAGANGASGTNGTSGDDAPRWGRFWFDASIRELDDLWRLHGAAPPLFLVQYREPGTTPFPTGAQVCGWHRVEGLRAAWHEAVVANPPPHVADHERAAFARFIARQRAL